MNCKEEGQIRLNKTNFKKFFKSRLCLILALTLIFSSGAAVCLTNIRKITIVDEGRKTTLFTTSGDTDAILKQVGITLNDTDTVSQQDNTLNVLRRYSVTMTADGNTQTMAIAKGSTVENALAIAGIDLSGHDTVSLPLDNAILGDTDINVDRVEYKTVTENKVINYDEYVKLLKEGRIKEANALKAGMSGKMTYTYQYKMVNGAVSSQTIVSGSVKAIEPETKKATPAAAKPASSPAKTSSGKKGSSYTGKLQAGTAVVSASGKKLSTISALTPKTPVQLDKNGVPVSYSKKITGKATAYYDYDGSKTATGKKTQTGYIAVNPKIIPYGTKMYIRTPDNKIIYGYASAEDTGGFIKSGKIIADLFFDTNSECINFGVRNIEIYILN